MKRTILLLTVVMIIGLLVTSCARKDVVKIGAAFPLTGDGAIFGISQRNAAQLAIDELNKAGGLNGKRIIMLVEDDMALPREAVSAAQKLSLDREVLAVIGHPYSSCAIPASKVYNENNVVFLTTTATNPVLTNQGFRNVFRFAPTDDMQGFSIADFIFSKLEFSSIALLHDNAAYGKGIAENVKKRFLELGGRILIEDSIDPESRDFRDMIIKLRRINPSVVFFGGMLHEGAQLVKQAKEMGLETIFVFGDGCYDQTFIDLAGTDCKNVFISFIAAPVDQLESTKAFYENYKREFGEMPSLFAPYAYDAIYLLIDALNKSTQIDRESLLETMSGDDYSYVGITGPITFDENGQTTGRSFYFYTFDDEGKLSLVR